MRVETRAEPLIFELDAQGRSGVDLPEVTVTPKVGDAPLRETIGLPELSEPTVMRHYTRLSQLNMSIDSNMYPLGSCTMKHNPRLNEKVVRLPGFARAHPLQPQSQVQGALGLIHELANWLTTLTNTHAVAMSPSAGAHGELCGMMCIQAALRDRGDDRKIVLVPESAHGTNPATAATLGFKVEAIKANDAGRVDMASFKEKLNDQVAAIMLTNPNTCGLFEPDIATIADLIHEVGGYFYCDGANYNALMGRVRPGDLGIDAMHINLHKTFSTPHGGGGPGAGPVVLSEALAPYAPLPAVVKDDDGTYRLVETPQDDPRFAKSLGRIKAFHGQMGMFIRTLSYILSHGADGLYQASSDAVLNANYIKAGLSDVMAPSYEGACMHEALFDEHALKDTGVTTLDMAKALIDEGFHPMTIYFPLVVKGAMLIEPTETEDKITLDRFISVMRTLVAKAKKGGGEAIKNTPQHAFLKRLDETAAARNPILRWEP
ncbi:MAG: aminomethyl-transferring glycine dehydrogenase subunit GcvPB [Pseudomonadota bacterium]